MKTVALFSTKEDLDFLKTRKDFKELKLVALTPEADFWGAELNLAYSTIEDYYDEASLNIEGAKNDNIIERICVEIDKELPPDIKHFSSLDIFMFIKILYDQILITHHFCQGLIKKELPKNIILLNMPCLQNEIMVNNNHDLLMNVILYYFSKRKVEMSIFNYKINKKNKKISMMIIFYNIISILKILKFKSLNAISNIKKRDKPAIFIAQHHNFQTCLDLQDFYRVYWLQNILFPFNKGGIYYSKNLKLKNSVGIKNLLFLDDICYFNLIEKKIQHVLFFLSREIESIAEKLSKYFFHKKIKAVIASSGQSREILAAIRAGSSLDLPIIWGQHGGLYGYGDFPLEKKIVRFYTHYFLYSKAVSNICFSKPYFVVSDYTLLRLYHDKRRSN